jgi:hypothetical protein
VISNTGHKGIHLRAERGYYQVIVQWRGRIEWGTADSLIQAIGLRNRFERELGKPRTERRILPDAVGWCPTVSGRKGHQRHVIQARIAPAPGRQLSTTYVFRDGESEDNAVRRAIEWRWNMETRYYA